MLDEMLEENGVLPMADRIPIVGFGSNASPGQLVHKFSERFSDQLSRDNDKFIIPTLFGQLKDVAVAYSSKFGLRSYVFAELMAAAGLNTNVAINFCSPEQLDVIRISEGAYHLCDFGKEVAVPGLKKALPAYGFAGKNNVVLYPSNGNNSDDKNDVPILLDAVTPDEQTALPSMDQAELLSYLVETVGYRLLSLYPLASAEVGPAVLERLIRADDPQVRAEMLVTLGQCRTNYTRRNNTAKTTYKHAPENGQPEDRPIGDAILSILARDGLVAKANLLSALPPQSIDVEPPTFAVAYAQNR